MYDRALATVQSAQSALDDYLKRQRRRLGCKTICYWGTGRNRYQLEVPDSVPSRLIPDEYDLKSQRKGFRRWGYEECEGVRMWGGRE